MKKVLLGLMVLAGFAACTSDDVVISGDTSKTFDGEKAYLTVRINDAGSTRATAEGYKPGEAATVTGQTYAENAISKANFYFYDEDGIFVSRGEIDNLGGNAVTPDSDNGEIEFTTEAVVVLEGLTGTKYPRYMVTVLNEHDGFESNAALYDPAETLDEFEQKWSYGSASAKPEGNSATTSGIWDENSYFVMSTASYYADDTNAISGYEQNTYPFVTVINENDFYTEPIDMDTSSPVDVWVDRLAAKVEVSVSAATESFTGYTYGTDGSQSTETTTYTNGYKVLATVAGTANPEVDGPDANNDDVADYEQAADHVMIEILGWELNATPRQSYISKNIQDFASELTTVTNLWTGWNEAQNHRTEWGKAVNYGVSTYALSSDNGKNSYTGDQQGNYPAEEAASSTWLDEYLEYKNLADPQSIDDATNTYYRYCAENTNSAEALVNKRNTGITSVLLKAQAWVVDTEDDGTNGEIYKHCDLIRIEGELFTEAAFQNYIIDKIAARTYLGDYYEVTTDGGETIYTPLLTTANYSKYFDLQYEGDGSVSLICICTSDTFDSSKSYVQYGYDTTAEDYGYISRTVTEVLNAFLGDGTNTIYAQLSNELEMQGYKDGLMYYSIPIEHLNETYPDGHTGEVAKDETSGENIVTVNEGNYGIVRNTWYLVDIIDISNIGKGIWDEQEVIVPDEYDPTYYYVTTSININAWQTVRQQASI